LFTLQKRQEEEIARAKGETLAARVGGFFGKFRRINEKIQENGKLEYMYKIFFDFFKKNSKESNFEDFLLGFSHFSFFVKKNHTKICLMLLTCK
jgi:hypothetical protein